MSIGPVGSGFNIVPLQAARPAPASEQTKGFGERIDAALDQLKASQTQASQSARAWELGAEQDLAAVMVDQQVASLGFQLTLNVRNKALGAYRDIMNMPL
ncbi:flagellar hook-basal body complex protein FliE [Pseudotabrizicola algicola]|uniref:Flagellar hook-basal body complex protein FliE n=1 Tax=Pseudotabrizicola algicola TaxID=2709381 RepID=A0A6B3RH50_9RHOB|nr:flagellar hook-basal body complex protein FliE [Pseudotabrizicola algicola]NEX45290.1 flagellar hook-basal body complex protein FliE [Pseudotabrizicola algicola]